MTSLSADGVLRAKFRPTRFREGYDQDEVDDFLDTVTAVLRSHEAGERVDAVAAAELCRNASFRPTKFREGYDQHEVDDLIAALEQGLLAIAGRGAGAPAGTGGATPPDGRLVPPADNVAAVLSPRPGEYPVRRMPAIGLFLVITAAVGVVALMVNMFAM
ncbi:DivIVA domain-containing protein [Georgenia sp. SUBG003]|uniref:DivIVA domain-containing protein n=1 Tax=Georgenia sp. SUBG003 TaxID=1497974 RepID=UPI000694516B